MVVVVKPVGVITRGTTAPNRLRRVDRWLTGTAFPLLRGAPDRPLAVDLGYGAYPVTTVEFARRLRAVRPDAQVVGLEIDPARVRAALPFRGPGLDFRLGGFELPVAGEPVVVRAFNVLRQYGEAEVGPVWERLAGRLAPGGLLVEGTCSESGRIAVWVALGRSGPRSLTFSARLAALDSPLVFAERLPKALIHRNVPGERVHAFLADWERCWQRAAPIGAFGARQRWIAAAEALAGQYPLPLRRDRWRLGELTVPWTCVAPG
ncbi:MAG TPA: class I SAM-dependent methyltransferase [Actinocrinis sp.]|nr:class I SAM-dependent methyltransferase [Actinocrinis sp.]